MCVTSSKLNVMLHFYSFFFHFFTHKSTKSVIEQLHISACESFFSVTVINALNKHQSLIQTKCFGKVHHIESAQLHTHGPSATLTDGSLYISHLK